VLEPILAVIGTMKLRELDAAAVDRALSAMASGYSSAAVRMGHLALKRAIRFAAARDLVARNVAELSETPAGQHGRPSRSFTLDQSLALIKASAGSRIGAYIALSLGTGIRTEEARALQWDVHHPGRAPVAHDAAPGWHLDRARGRQRPVLDPRAGGSGCRRGRRDGWGTQFMFTT